MKIQAIACMLLSTVAIIGCQRTDHVALTEAEWGGWREVLTHPEAQAFDVRLYNQGKSVGDAAVMYDALHRMWVREPQNQAIQDSLATLYFRGRMWGQSLSMVEDLLEAKPEEVRLLEMRAVAQNGLGRLEEALSSYEALVAKDPNPYFHYQIATLQYGLNQFDEAESTVDGMLAAELNGQSVSISVGNGRNQSVPMKAALLNIKGVLRKDVHKDFETARQYFELAMAEAPEFILARNNMTVLTNESAVQ